MDNPNVLKQEWDLGEHDNQAIFPSRRMESKTMVMIRKKDFKVFETDTMIILESTEYES